VVAIVVAIGFMSYSSKPFLGDTNLLVEVMISDPTTIKAVLPMVGTTKKVYYSGSKYQVEQISHNTEQNNDGTVKYLYITLRGLGKISDGASIFNGQRIYNNQKVEIRSDYQAQGYITDFYYES